MGMDILELVVAGTALRSTKILWVLTTTLLITTASGTAATRKLYERFRLVYGAEGHFAANASYC